MLRADPFGGWEFLSPPVRAWYARRVVVAGAESTGTTTLASDLAAALGTNWVPEFGREYSEQKLRRGEMEWNSAEFVAIAAEQTRLENQAAREANRILVCDTNAFATVLWHRRYLGRDHPPLQEAASRCVSHLYILTGDEIPFVQDGLRDGEHIRHEMHRWFLTALTGQSSPWLPVQGSRQERLSAALRACRNILGWPREATPGAG